MKADKTRVVLRSADNQHKDWEEKERGFVDGYVRGGNDVPLAVVCLDRGDFVLVPINVLEKESNPYKP